MNEENLERISDFLKEIEEVCSRYNLSIAHEDCHGGFIIEKYSKDNIQWLKYASIEVEE